MRVENPEVKKHKSVAVIVAHPDDETLWSGGTILFHPQWDWTIISLSRAKDTDRAPRFFKALQLYGATGAMGDMDDSPEQTPLPDETVEDQVLALLPVQHYDLVISHHPQGEYTRHLRHEEVSRAVIRLWREQKIEMDELWVFAYEDGLRSYPPEAVPEATIYHVLDQDTWQRKYEMMTHTYGFTVDSWEATTTPLAESFWCFSNPEEAWQWLNSLPSEL